MKRLGLACNAIVQALEPRVLLAASTINNFNPAQSVVGGVTIGGVTYYDAYQGVQNTIHQLIRSDGTPSGTYSITEPSDNVDGLQPIDLFNFNGTLYFEALAANGADGLYTSDGTSAGTTLILTFGQTVNPSFTQVGNELYFFGTDSSGNENLYKTDGTSAGPTLVQTLETGAVLEPPLITPSMANLNGTLYFTAPDLWKLDSNGQPELVKSFGDQNQAGGDLIAVNNTLYFKAQDPSNPYQLDLWESDGTTAGTNILWTNGISDLPGGGDFFAFNNDLYFVTDSNASGYQLYCTDGTVAGTTLLTNPGFTFDQQIGFAVADGKLFFAASSGPSSKTTLWTSDGTANGTLPVVDPSIGVTSMLPGGNALYFISNNGDLYETDGSSTALADPSESSNGWVADRLLGQSNGGLVFGATDSAGNETTWVLPAPAALPPAAPHVAVPPPVAPPQMAVSYGTPVELQAVSDNPSPAEASFISGVSIDGIVYYTADDVVDGWQVWKTDGTAAGTSMVSDINAAGGGCQPSDLTDYNGTLYFITAVFTGTNIEQDLYKTDGTPGGTTLVAANVQTAPIQLGNELYFIAYDSSSNITNLYETNGTTAGTATIPGVFNFSGATGSIPMVTMGGNLYLEIGSEILQVTPAGQTQVVATLPAAPDPSDPELYDLYATDNAIYFTDNDPYVQSPLALFANDGSPGSTSVVFSNGSNYDVVYAAAPAGDDLIFLDGQTLYSSNGTAAGTYAIGPDSILATVGNNEYFEGGSGFDPDNPDPDSELWITDGTPAGTKIVAPSVGVGWTSIMGENVLVANNSLYFVGANGEFYQTDGTATAWINPLISSGVPESGCLIGLSANGLVFSSGTQLWVLSTQAAPPLGPTTPTLPPTSPPVSPPPAIPPPPTPQSALIPAIENVRLASQVIAGSRLNASVPIVVTNTGTTIKGKMTVELFVENGSTLDGTQVLLATKKRRVALKAGQTASFTFSVKSLPASLQGGAYHLIAEVIDPSGDTNTVATSQTVEVETRIVQVTLDPVSVTPDIIAPGKFGWVDVTVTNSGNAASTGGTITLDLAAAPVSPSSGVTLKTIHAGLAIPAGTTRKFRLRFKIPAKTTPTNYILYTMVSFDGEPGAATSNATLTVSDPS